MLFVAWCHHYPNWPARAYSTMQPRGAAAAPPPCAYIPVHGPTSPACVCYLDQLAVESLLYLVSYLLFCTTNSRERACCEAWQRGCWCVCRLWHIAEEVRRTYLSHSGPLLLLQSTYALLCWRDREAFGRAAASTCCQDCDPVSYTHRGQLCL